MEHPQLTVDGQHIRLCLAFVVHFHWRRGLSPVIHFHWRKGLSSVVRFHWRRGLSSAVHFHLRRGRKLLVGEPRVERVVLPAARMALVIRMLPVIREGDWLPGFLAVGLPGDGCDAEYSCDGDDGPSSGTLFMISSCSATVDGRCRISAAIRFVSRASSIRASSVVSLIGRFRAFGGGLPSSEAALSASNAARMHALPVALAVPAATSNAARICAAAMAFAR